MAGETDLVELWKEQWPSLSDGKPIMATTAIVETYDDEILKALWSLYGTWRIYVLPKLPEGERQFVTDVGPSTVWILESDDSYCVMFDRERRRVRRRVRQKAREEMRYCEDLQDVADQAQRLWG